MEAGWQVPTVDKDGAQAIWVLCNHGDTARAEDGAVNVTAEKI